jgi:hypothetical protein
MVRFSAVLVERPSAWRPSGLLDIPVGGRLLGIEAAAVSEEFARHYNNESLENSGDTWVVLVRNPV